MLRVTAARLSKQAPPAGRTIIRDPRKNKAILSQIQVVKDEHSQSQLTQHSDGHHSIQSANPMVPQPSHGQSSFGATMGSYVLYGAGITLGFTLVKLILGV